MLITITSTTLLSIVLSVGAVTSAQLSRQVSLYFGPYYVNGPSPDNLVEFAYFSINTGKQPRNPKIGASVSVGGYLRTKGGIDYKFTNAKLTMANNGFDRLTFKTKDIRGTSYRFDGSFLSKPLLVSSTGNYTTLHGTLVKEQNGQRSCEASLDFFVWIEE